ncbi:hypothetical protein pb186bvf_004767 [Paramecium bursaria]
MDLNIHKKSKQQFIQNPLTQYLKILKMQKKSGQSQGQGQGLGISGGLGGLGGQGGQSLLLGQNQLPFQTLTSNYPNNQTLGGGGLGSNNLGNLGQTGYFDQQNATNEMKPQTSQLENQSLPNQEKQNQKIQQSLNKPTQSDNFSDMSPQKILELIQKYKLHYDPFYTRIYGIVHDIEYLKNANDNFEIAYKNLIEYLEKNDRLTKWYEKEIKEFHQQYGIPAILNQRWISFNSGLSVLSIYCCITLYHSDPLLNVTYLREQYQDKILEYINLKQDQQEQQLLKDFLIKLEKRQEVDINSIKVLSLISNLNIMVHQDMIPSQDPKLIAQGEEVFKDDFPKYNILQLFTLDQKLYYYIHVKDEFNKMLLDQYVHYNTKIQHINYEEQAKLHILDKIGSKRVEKDRQAQVVARFNRWQQQRGQFQMGRHLISLKFFEQLNYQEQGRQFIDRQLRKRMKLLKQQINSIIIIIPYKQKSNYKYPIYYSFQNKNYMK